MAKPIPQLKRPAVPADIAERFISAGSTAVTPAVALQPATLTVVPEPAVEAADPVAAEPSVLEASTPVAMTAPNDDARTSTRRPRNSGRQLTKRASGAELRKVTFYLPPDLDTELSVHCARNGLDRTDVVVAALKKLVKTP